MKIKGKKMKKWEDAMFNCFIEENMSLEEARKEIVILRLMRGLEKEKALVRICNLQMGAKNLSEYLKQVLNVFMGIAWIRTSSKRGVLFINRENHLERVASVGFPENECSKVNYGECLCGKAAETREVIFTGNVCKDHTTRIKEIPPHGHCILPIKEGPELLGVLCLYLDEGIERDSEEEEFLMEVCNAVAQAIKAQILKDAIAHMAGHDALTELPNRALFMDRLEQALRESKRHRGTLTVMFVDLDGFKRVNDDCGHDTGDELLRSVAARIRAAIRDKDTVARIGGDEFAVILPNTSPEQAQPVAERIIFALGKPFKVDEYTCQIGASIGISHFPAHGETTEDLLKKADAAMYLAKKSGRNCFRFYSPDTS